MSSAGGEVAGGEGLGKMTPSQVEEVDKWIRAGRTALFWLGSVQQPLPKQLFVTKAFGMLLSRYLKLKRDDMGCELFPNNGNIIFRRIPVFLTETVERQLRESDG